MLVFTEEVGLSGVNKKSARMVCPYCCFRCWHVLQLPAEKAAEGGIYPQRRSCWG